MKQKESSDSSSKKSNKQKKKINPVSEYGAKKTNIFQNGVKQPNLEDQEIPFTSLMEGET
jgi:hypothetical protein